MLCHICKKNINGKHFFYKLLCQDCGELNYTKRTSTSDLSNRIALVSGARVKIGYYVGLRLLRNGAKVIALTRFPHDAALRYAKESDFEQWKHNLDIYGLDFRDLRSVDAFIQYLYHSYPYIDILINNAAQTVRRPPKYYEHLLPIERKPISELPESARILLSSKNNFQGKKSLFSSNEKTNAIINSKEKSFMNSVELSQIPLIEEDFIIKEDLLPKGELDQYNEQIDLRDYNTWVTHLEDVSIPEILEVQLINQVVPTMFVSKLKKLLLKSPKMDKYIVNVSSAEGQFSLSKDGRHPHTCIAKAALNMLTFSIAEDYAFENIYVTSADPGWVTEQFPRKGTGRRKHYFALDLEDAATRVCDPIFMGVNENKYWRCCLFKHFKKARW